MTFGSVFTGIGGFDLGLERAGWECAWQVEKDPNALAILRHQYPQLPRYTDVTEVHGADLAPVDLLVGGFPCQDVSVAGDRRGLAGERSGLFFEFMRLVDELTPRWLLIENVPGLLSSNSGRDMGTVLRALGERDYWWTSRVLDTRYFGPPQRRGRVFIVGHLGAPCPPEILFEPESLPWYPPPQRDPRQSSAPGAEGGTGTGRVLIEDPNDPVANTLPTKYRGDPHEQTDTIVVNPERGLAPHGSMEGEFEVSPPLTESEWRGQTFIFKASHYTRGKDGAPADVSPPLSADADRGDQDMLVVDGRDQGEPLPFDTTQLSHPENRSNPKPGDPSHTLPSDGHPPAIAFNIYPVQKQGADLEASETDHATLSGRAQQTERGTRIVEQAYHEEAPTLFASGAGTERVASAGSEAQFIVGSRPRRLTPTECERLHGFPDGWTAVGQHPPKTKLDKRVGLAVCPKCGNESVAYQEIVVVDGEEMLSWVWDKHCPVECEFTEKRVADTPRYRALGNAVSVPVAHWIGERIRKAHEEEEA